MSEHENVVECIEWAPESAVAHLRNDGNEI